MENGVREEPHAFAHQAIESWPHRFTVAQYIRLGELELLPLDGQGRTELVDGRIEVMPTDGDLHVYSLGVLAELFYRAILGDPSLDGVVRIHVKASLELGPDHCREPDLMIVSPAPHNRLPLPSHVHLIVETSVTSRQRDLEDKRRAYAAAGVLEYWVWDAENRALVIFREPSAGDYGAKQTLMSGDAKPLFAPQIAIPIAALIPVD
jgi:Uma2 family endonuclease